MGCILDDCEELEEKRRKKHEEYVRTGFQPDCRRCFSHNYDGPDYKVCNFDHNPEHCGSYNEMNNKEVLDRAANIAEKISRLRANLHFLELMDEEHQMKEPSDNDRKFVSEYFGVPYTEEEADSDEEDDEDSVEEDSFQLPKKMR